MSRLTDRTEPEGAPHGDRDHLEELIAERTADLERSRAFLQTTSQLARLGGWELDLEKNELSWSDVLYQIHEVEPGYRPTVESAIEFYAPEAVPVISEAIRLAIAEGRPYDVELQLITARKKRLWVRAVGEAIREDGKVVKIRGAFQDIEKRKRAEIEPEDSRGQLEELVAQRTAELKESQRSLVEAQRGARLGSWRWDAVADEISGSEEFYRLFEAVPEAILRFAQLVDRLHPDDRERVQQDFAEAVRLDRPYDTDYRVSLRGGGWRSINARGRVFTGEDGKPLRAVGTCLDITERRRMEEDLRRAFEGLGHEKQLIDAIVNSMPGVFYTLDSAGRFVRWNANFERVTGYGCQELGAMTALELFASEDQQRVARAIQEVAEKGEATVEAEILNKAGHRTPYFFTGRRAEIRGTPHLVGMGIDITEQRRTEEALRLGEQEFRTLAEAMPQIVWITRPDGWNTYFNQQWVDYTGMTLEESYGHGWNIPFHPDDRQRAWDAWQQATATVGTYSVECRLRRFDGAYRWWLIRGVPLRDAEGGILKWFGTCTDVDDMKTAEEALRESRTILQAALDQSPAGIAIADAPDGKLRYVNDAGLLIRGGTRETIVDGVGIDQYVAGWQALDLDGRPLRSDEIPLTRSILFGETSSRELMIRRERDDDRIVLANAAPIRNTSGEVTAGIVVFTDITDQKATEKALARSEDLYRRLAEGLERRVEERTVALARNRQLLDETSHLSQVGGWEYDVRTKALTWTDVTYEIHEIEKGIPLLVENALGYFAPECRPRITEVFQRAVATGEPYDEEVELITPKGRRKWVRAIGFADSEDGKVVRVHGLFQDIHVHKSRIAALVKANEEIESFSYSVSHDLRAPLRHIHGFIEILLEDLSGKLDEKSLRYIRLVSEASRKMGVLIDDLLAFSRIGRVELLATRSPLRPLVDEVIRELAPDIGGREIIWEIAPLPEVFADPAMLRQVFSNLIGNALKFSRERAPARIEIGTVDAGALETLCFVRDNGVGFDMKYVDKLFRVFQRLHANEQFDGVGIGLANVQLIVQRHGGRVWAEGSPGGGATFWFSLPKKETAS